MKPIDRMKKQYKSIEIPSELEEVVHQSIQQAKNVKKRSPFKKWSLGAVAAAALFITSINVSPTIAQSMINVPLVGPIVEAFTIKTWKVDEERFQAELNTPAITGLENKELEATLNEKYIAENKLLFEQFERQMTETPEGYYGLDTGYEIKTDTDHLFSVARYEVSTAGSATQKIQYDTVDKKNNILITLPSLFKDERYIGVITDFITEEMKRQMAIDEDLTYYPLDGPDAYAHSIDREHEFYITADHTLVISFGEYDVAPGLMGLVEFEIPSAILQDLLVSDMYIR